MSTNELPPLDEDRDEDGATFHGRTSVLAHLPPSEPTPAAAGSAEAVACAACGQKAPLHDAWCPLLPVLRDFPPTQTPAPREAPDLARALRTGE
jgi:hypothetical protein